MAVTPPDSQSYAQSSNLLDNSLGIEVPLVPPFRFGPDSWNLLYYMILGVSLLFGFLAFASSGSWSDALLYFLISLLGTTFLGISFLSFVIMPLFLKHRERVLEARRAAVLAAKAAAIERNEQMLAERHRTMAANLRADTSAQNHAVFTGQESTAEPTNAPLPATNPTVEDQASSLRRMVDAGK
jgi:hypothetical protein